VGKSPPPTNLAKTATSLEQSINPPNQMKQQEAKITPKPQQPILLDMEQPGPSHQQMKVTQQKQTITNPASQIPQSKNSSHLKKTQEDQPSVMHPPPTAVHHPMPNLQTSNITQQQQETNQLQSQTKLLIQKFQKLHPIMATLAQALAEIAM